MLIEFLFLNLKEVFNRQNFVDNIFEVDFILWLKTLPFFTKVELIFGYKQFTILSQLILKSIDYRLKINSFGLALWIFLNFIKICTLESYQNLRHLFVEIKVWINQGQSVQRLKNDLNLTIFDS